jgi:hypothetical protein
MGTVARIPGLSVTLDGQPYVIPPLSLGALEQLRPRLLAFDEKMDDPEQISTVIDTLHAALRRNYPELTRERVADMVDLANFGEAMRAAMNVSGLAKGAAASPGAPPGEAIPSAA